MQNFGKLRLRGSGTFKFINFFLMFVFFCLNCPSVSAEQKGFEFSLSKPDPIENNSKSFPESNLFAATLSITIAAGHHIYRDRSSLNGKNIKIVTQKWPEPVYQKDPFTGEKISVLPSGKSDIYLELAAEISTDSLILESSNTNSDKSTRVSKNTTVSSIQLHKSSEISSYGKQVGVHSGETINDASFECQEKAQPSGNKDLRENWREGKLQLSYQGCSTQTCFLPDDKSFPVSFSMASWQLSNNFVPGITTGNIPASGNSLIIPQSSSSSTTSFSEKNNISNFGSFQTPAGKADFSAIIRQEGLLKAVLFAFLAGLLVSLTPCVYPMIPITLSIIGGRRENTSALRGMMLSITYVAGLSITYAFLGLIVAKFGAHVRGFIQGPFFQLFIALIFALLSLSMFDVFMLQTPSFLRQKLQLGKKEGFGGIFFLGMLSGLLASPCVAAPLAGILAYIASTGSVILGFSLLLSFSWGMGVLLILVGTFSGTLNSLPKAGVWMEKVKEFYGFLLAGAALYFAHPVIGTALSNIATAALLAALAAFLGLFQNGNNDRNIDQQDDNGSLFPCVMKCWGVVILAVACAFALNSAAEWGGLSGIKNIPQQPFNESAVSIKWYYDYDEARQVANSKNTPLFIDFRADWCPICKELEKSVFPDPIVSRFSEKITFLKIDLSGNNPDEKELSKKYQVIGLPTLLFLKPSGEEIHHLRITGGIEAKDLAESLNEAISQLP
ncbi:MAG: protein-disulfide reductase DsbD [Candidatus Riflebacteria bacterium]|nr:protein-disulfide reductase DsbD [Candidatus Riflebacteria bacterium]